MIFYNKIKCIFYHGFPIYNHFDKNIKELVTNHVYINKNEKQGIIYNDRLEACWVDIDTNSEERFVALLLDILEDMEQPPNSIIFSGHGFYFIFKFDK